MKPVSLCEVQVKDISNSSTLRKERTSSTIVPNVPFCAIKGYVIAVYDAKWYLACVLETHPATQEIQLSFLHPEGPARSYHYPAISDILLMDSRDVLHVVEPTTITGRVYSLSKKDTSIAMNAFQQ